MLRKAVLSWAKKIGDNEARARLVRRGLSSSTVDRLVAGTYGSSPKGASAVAILDELAKDGFTVDGGAAS